MRKRLTIWRLKRSVVEVARWVEAADDNMCECGQMTNRHHQVLGLVNVVKRLRLAEEDRLDEAQP